MPNYFYNQDPQEAAAYGQGLGQSLGQAFIGLPMERARLAQGLMQMQQMAALRNSQMQQLGEYRQGMLQNAQEREKDRASYQQSQDAYRQLMGQVAVMREQQMMNDPRRFYLPLGGGNFIGPSGASNALNQGPPQPQEQTGAPMQGVGQQLGGGYQLYSAPQKNMFTPNEQVGDLQKMQQLYAGLVSSTNPVLQRLGMDVSNQIGALRPMVMNALTNRGGPFPQQLGTNAPAFQQGSTNANDPLGLGL